MTEITTPQPEATYVIKTQLDAVAYLADHGYSISKSAFNRHVQQRHVPTTQGGFDTSALLGFAAAYLKPIKQVQNNAVATATAGKLSADAKLKEYQAERTRIKLEREQGLTIPRAQYEEDLAARALFFRAEIESWIDRKGAELIAVVNGDESKLEELYRWWEAETADWLDAWDSDTEFASGEDEEEEDA